MKILTFTTLYPNAIRPTHGIFVENRLRHLLADGNITCRVVAPVPWFPFRSPRFGDYGKLARVPPAEERFGVSVIHPRYPSIPKFGMTLAPYLLFSAMKPVIGRILEEGDEFDLIDAHYFYPDGVAAVMLGQHFGKPVVVTARGTDLNLIPEYRLPRKMIAWAAERAAGLVTVSNALKNKLKELGVEGSRITVLRNGVDLGLFRPVDRDAARRELGLEGTVLLSVGHLIERKAHDLIISALPSLPDTNLIIVGDGPEDQKLRNLAHELGVEKQVRFLGRVPHEKMRDTYGLADVLVLASSREGWANVLLEAMACGTHVIASNVWGAPEVVAAPEAGLLLPERTPEEIAKAVHTLMSRLPDRAATRAYAERFSWDDTTRGQVELFRRITKDVSPTSNSVPATGISS